VCACEYVCVCLCMCMLAFVFVCVCVNVPPATCGENAICSPPVCQTKSNVCSTSLNTVQQFSYSIDENCVWVNQLNRICTKCKKIRTGRYLTHTYIHTHTYTY